MGTKIIECDELVLSGGIKDSNGSFGTPGVVAAVTAAVTAAVMVASRGRACGGQGHGRRPQW